MIYAVIMSKGGVGKSTLCFNLAHSKAFQKKFKNICLIELDSQGSLHGLIAKRTGSHLPALVDFYHLDVENPQDLKRQIKSIQNDHDCIVIDTAGEGLSGMGAQYVLMNANRVLIPCRSTALDEDALQENMLPLIQEILKRSPHRRGCYSVVPSMIHPQANFHNVIQYFKDNVVPNWIELFRTVIVNRAVIENFNRDGSSLYEYQKSVRGNKQERIQAEKATSDYERIAEYLAKEAP